MTTTHSHDLKAVCDRLRDLDSRLPPLTFWRLKLRLFKSIEELSASIKKGDRKTAVRGLLYIAARCLLFAEGLQENGAGDDR